MVCCVRFCVCTCAVLAPLSVRAHVRGREAFHYNTGHFGGAAAAAQHALRHACGVFVAIARRRGLFNCQENPS
ncbi:exported hypothetical protein [Paraburkholderia tropica]|nr:exported hypothetical protein [Paraburkholderia tropica]